MELENELYKEIEYKGSRQEIEQKFLISYYTFEDGQERAVYTDETLKAVKAALGGERPAPLDELPPPEDAIARSLSIVTGSCASSVLLAQSGRCRRAIATRR